MMSRDYMKNVDIRTLMAQFSAHIRNADVKNFNRITSNLKKI